MPPLIEETVRRHQTKPNSNEFGETQMREWYVARDILDTPNEKIYTENQSQEEIFRELLNEVQSHGHHL